MFQILIPSIVVLLGFNAINWTIYGLIHSKDEDAYAKEMSKGSRKIAGILSLISFSIFYWYVSYISSINNDQNAVIKLPSKVNSVSTPEVGTKK